MTSTSPTTLPEAVEISSTPSKDQTQLTLSGENKTIHEMVGSILQNIQSVEEGNTKQKKELDEQKKELDEQKKGVAKKEAELDEQKEELDKQKKELEEQKEELEEQKEGIRKQKEGITKKQDELANEENAIKEKRESIKAMNDENLAKLKAENERLLQERKQLKTDLSECRAELETVNAKISSFMSSLNNNNNNKRRRLEAIGAYNQAEGRYEREYIQSNEDDNACNETSADYEVISVLLPEDQTENREIEDRRVAPQPCLRHSLQDLKAVEKAAEGVFGDLSRDGIFDVERYDACSWNCVEADDGCGEDCLYGTVEKIKKFARDNQIQKGGLHLTHTAIANTRTRKNWKEMGKNDPTFQQQFNQSQP